MSVNIRKAFLHDPENRCLQLGRESSEIRGKIEIDLDLAALCESV